MTLPPLPPSVSAFGRQIQKEQDLVGKFVEDCCELDPAFDAAAAASYVKDREHRFLYLKSNFCRDFREVHSIDFSTAHENQLKASHGVVTRRLKAGGYSSGQTYYVGLRATAGDGEKISSY